MLNIFFRLLFLALSMAFAAAVGALVDPERGAVAGAILVGVWVYFLQARSGLKILRWLDDFRLDNVPLVSGWWDDLSAKLFKYLKLHQRQQQALSNTLASFRTAAQALPDGVVTLDSHGHIIWCNSTAQKHLGLKLSTDIGQPLINLVRFPDFSKYLSSKSWEAPLVMRAPRNNQKILSIQAVSYGDGQMLVLTRDVTKLEKLERMRRDFIANVSHELKTPLTVLSGFLETFRDLPLSEEQRAEYLNLMYGQATRMQNLVEDLLTLSSLESGSPQGDGEPVSLSALTQRIVDEAIQVSGGKHKINVVQIKPDLYCEGNEAELYSAFLNIATNAIRYTPDGGTVSVELGSMGSELGTGKQAYFRVKDTGIGIPPEHIPRLTERFYRVDRSRSRESGGTGLGLAIVKHVVSRHDGELLITSTPQVGSTFEIHLPVCKSPLKFPSNTPKESVEINA
jgi:two-component system, OmpR family, phosphate regulon sensor histidine kinase PhoR